MNRNLFLSILAMDSYNRCYGQGVVPQSGDSTTNQSETGRKIGNATILLDANDAEGAARGAGFYAIAHQLNGQKIISYRGTNFELEGRRESELAKDAFNGWKLGAGFSSAAQAQQAYPARPLPPSDTAVR